MAKYTYSRGEYAYFKPKGEIVRIIGSTKKVGTFSDKYKMRVLSVKNIDPITGKPTLYYDCNTAALLPILDKDIQFLLEMSYNSPVFDMIRQL